MFSRGLFLCSRISGKVASLIQAIPRKESYVQVARRIFIWALGNLGTSPETRQLKTEGKDGNLLEKA
eukprot:1688858-Amphidinium_carterae.1